MNIRTKTYVIIVVTLLIGILFGILITRTLVRGRMARMMHRPPQEEFVQRFMRVIDPAPDQREPIRAVLEKHGAEFMKTAAECQEKFARLHESTKKELDPLLTPEQKKRLTDRIKRIRKRLPPFMRRKGPFPPPPPPFDPGREEAEKKED